MSVLDNLRLYFLASSPYAGHSSQQAQAGHHRMKVIGASEILAGACAGVVGVSTVAVAG